MQTEAAAPHCGFRIFSAAYPVGRSERLETLDELHHAPPLIGVRQRTAHRAEIIGHVRGIGSTRNDRGHARIGQQIFEEKLRPAWREALRELGLKP